MESGLDENAIFESPIENYAARFTTQELKVRDRFVEEVRKDNDKRAAAGRIGYPPALQMEYGNRFMQCPYVLQQLSKAQNSPIAEKAEDVRTFVLNRLREEALYTGPGASQSARVAALDKIAAIYGLHAPTKTQNQVLGPDGRPLEGVFVVPGIMSEEQWVQVARQQQEELTTQTAVPALTNA